MFCVFVVLKDLNRFMPLNMFVASCACAQCIDRGDWIALFLFRIYRFHFLIKSNNKPRFKVQLRPVSSVIQIFHRISKSVVIFAFQINSPKDCVHPTISVGKSCVERCMGIPKSYIQNISSFFQERWKEDGKQNKYCLVDTMQQMTLP